MDKQKKKFDVDNYYECYICEGSEVDNQGRRYFADEPSETLYGGSEGNIAVAESLYSSDKCYIKFPENGEIYITSSGAIIRFPDNVYTLRPSMCRENNNEIDGHRVFSLMPKKRW